MTIQIDDAVFARLDHVARATSRPLDDLVDEALRAYLTARSVGLRPRVPPVAHSDQLAGDFWPEDDIDGFLRHSRRRASVSATTGEPPCRD